jgi:hypothetical protein
MSFRGLCLVVLAVATLVCVSSLPAAEESGGGWRVLFDGKTLNGWEKHGGKAEYAVEEGVIAGHSVPKTSNTFLCTKDKFKDFELTFEVKIDSALNSGVQVRSELKGNDVVFGPQVEIAASPDGSGYIYGESTGRGWLSQDRPKTRVFKNGEWNKYRVVCRGASIKTWVNGEPVADLNDEASNHSGLIGLQVHGVGDRADPLYARWRNIKIREIK